MIKKSINFNTIIYTAICIVCLPYSLLYSSIADIIDNKSTNNPYLKANSDFDISIYKDIEGGAYFLYNQTGMDNLGNRDFYIDTTDNHAQSLEEQAFIATSGSESSSEAATNAEGLLQVNNIIFDGSDLSEGEEDYIFQSHINIVLAKNDYNVFLINNIEIDIIGQDSIYSTFNLVPVTFDGYKKISSSGDLNSKVLDNNALLDVIINLNKTNSTEYIVFGLYRTKRLTLIGGNIILKDLYAQKTAQFNQFNFIGTNINQVVCSNTCDQLEFKANASIDDNVAVINFAGYNESYYYNGYTDADLNDNVEIIWSNKDDVHLTEDKSSYAKDEDGNYIDQLTIINDKLYFNTAITSTQETDNIFQVSVYPGVLFNSKVNIKAYSQSDKHNELNLYSPIFSTQEDAEALYLSGDWDVFIKSLPYHFNTINSSNLNASVAINESDNNDLIDVYIENATLNIDEALKSGVFQDIYLDRYGIIKFLNDADDEVSLDTNTIILVGAGSIIEVGSSEFEYNKSDLNIQNIVNQSTKDSKLNVTNIKSKLTIKSFNINGQKDSTLTVKIDNSNVDVDFNNSNKDVENARINFDIVNGSQVKFTKLFQSYNASEASTIVDNSILDLHSNNIIPYLDLNVSTVNVYDTAKLYDIQAIDSKIIVGSSAEVTFNILPNDININANSATINLAAVGKVWGRGNHLNLTLHKTILLVKDAIFRPSSLNIDAESIVKAEQASEGEINTRLYFDLLPNNISVPQVMLIGSKAPVISFGYSNVSIGQLVNNSSEDKIFITKKVDSLGVINTQANNLGSISNSAIEVVVYNSLAQYKPLYTSNIAFQSEYTHFIDADFDNNQVARANNQDHFIVPIMQLDSSTEINVNASNVGFSNLWFDVKTIQDSGTLSLDITRHSHYQDNSNAEYKSLASAFNSAIYNANPSNAANVLHVTQFLDTISSKQKLNSFWAQVIGFDIISIYNTLKLDQSSIDLIANSGVIIDTQPKYPWQVDIFYAGGSDSVNNTDITNNSIILNASYSTFNFNMGASYQIGINNIESNGDLSSDNIFNSLSLYASKRLYKSHIIKLVQTVTWFNVDSDYTIDISNYQSSDDDNYLTVLDNQYIEEKNMNSTYMLSSTELVYSYQQVIARKSIIEYLISLNMENIWIDMKQKTYSSVFNSALESSDVSSIFSINANIHYIFLLNTNSNLGDLKSNFKVMIGLDSKINLNKELSFNADLTSYNSSIDLSGELDTIEYKGFVDLTYMFNDTNQIRSNIIAAHHNDGWAMSYTIGFRHYI